MFPHKLICKGWQQISQSTLFVLFYNFHEPEVTAQEGKPRRLLDGQGHWQG